jgi:exonuclease III
VFRRSDGTRAPLSHWSGKCRSSVFLCIGLSPVRRVEFVSDRMSYIILRGRWCNIIVVNVHDPCEDTSNDIKVSFYEVLGRVFDNLPKYDMKILLGDFNAKVGREDIFKPTIGNDSPHEISNDMELE